MADSSLQPLRYARDEMECARLSNLAWIEQAEVHNRKSHNLPGARARRATFATVMHWLDKLADLWDAAGGDEKVEAWLDRALAKAADAGEALT